ncbi:MAG: bifunctional glutamate N-acetyltransferase/amino-acid acetyltransferase ArgJ [Proteobacteria bacterium]|nr:bifunctional glutamate N-acetyltransferase/amino-acid acetyltransferase ArgJ [Pseudomonadota bacterium]MBU1585502.1 bifunctional glutamate N-acetyltransferase/amino-acid acetyltransferase ArgJ [Pseudomonadota bacterium]MBU2454663.1 bifunctional glutamate N-acetyltransferase/amino-acid acetyltransferase ArgJ [Pseudomonadota bacterium]MBU2629273.1 bifunctional glutamate N-acetyltransferase/amino-acid acetyltransferase ArgJ [Pseudomonadota bacterium]
MKGFKFAGIRAGIKKKDQKDLGMIYSDTPAVAAALFTRNKVVAAPVLLGKEKIKNGLCQAVLVNSGNANCFTGQKGIEDAIACTKIVAKSLDISEDFVLVSSTGVIGAILPMDKFETGVPALVGQLSENHVDDFADAILTTDTCRKIVTQTGTIGDKKFSIIGIAKGSGMIRPDMATMLAFICTDINILAEDLDACLRKANETSFNRITVDGDTSTNDTLLALANGAAQARVTDANSKKVFQEALTKVCFELAKMIVKDGEGATKLVQIIVKGAQTKQDAFKASEAIAHSNLVKTAIYGEDPNWGRITAAAGRSGAHVVPENMDLFFDDQPLVLKGNWQGAEAEKKTALIMKNNEITITLDLNLGQETDSFLFCDFSVDYVKINAEYRS